jgi:hypothetical protein
MSATLKLNPIAVNPIKIGKKIPAEIVKSPVYNPSRPISPLCTAFYINDAIYFRIVVFIDSRNKNQPTFSVASNNTDFYVEYDITDNVPESYSAWYIDVEYKCDIVDTVTIYLLDTDPEISRGTVIHVPHP